MQQEILSLARKIFGSEEILDVGASETVDEDGNAILRLRVFYREGAELPVEQMLSFPAQVRQVTDPIFGYPVVTFADASELTKEYAAQ